MQVVFRPLGAVGALDIGTRPRRAHSTPPKSPQAVRAGGRLQVQVGAGPRRYWTRRWHSRPRRCWASHIPKRPCRYASSLALAPSSGRTCREAGGSAGAAKAGTGIGNAAHIVSSVVRARILIAPLFSLGIEIAKALLRKSTSQVPAVKAYAWRGRFVRWNRHCSDGCEAMGDASVQSVVRLTRTTHGVVNDEGW